MSKGWWYRATTEQRLAQIDAGIELGMTAAQVAMNCGCLADQDFNARGQLGSGKLVSDYALRHGRQFPRKGNRSQFCGLVRRDGKLIPRRKAHIDDARNRYLSGEVVDFWGAR